MSEKKSFFKCKLLKIPKDEINLLFSIQHKKVSNFYKFIMVHYIQLQIVNLMLLEEGIGIKA